MRDLRLALINSKDRTRPGSNSDHSPEAQRILTLARAALVRAMLSAPEAEAATLAQYHARITATLATSSADGRSSRAAAP